MGNKFQLGALRELGAVGAEQGGKEDQEQPGHVFCYRVGGEDLTGSAPGVKPREVKFFKKAADQRLAGLGAIDPGHGRFLEERFGQVKERTFSTSRIDSQ